MKGKRMEARPPFSNHTITQQRVMNGLPFSVYCCWNGLVVLNANGFYEGIRFREADYEKNECSASECSLFCNDMWKLNYTKMVMDPNVRLAYDIVSYRTVNEMYWLESSKEKQNSIDKNIPFFEKPSNWTCCPLVGTSSTVYFDDCFDQPTPSFSKE